MTARTLAESFAGVLRRITAGTAEATIDGQPFARLDAEQRNLLVHVDPLLTDQKPLRSLLTESHVHLWETRGVPGALARSGWRFSLQEGADELVRLGRDTSVLTGHIHVSPSVLRRRRRVLGPGSP